MADNKNKNSSNTKRNQNDKNKPENVKKRSGSSDKSQNGSSKQNREPIKNAVPDEPSSKFIHQFIPYILSVFALLLVACFVCVHVFYAEGAVGVIGRGLNNVCCGLFGWPAFLIPLILFNLAFFWRKYVDMGLVPLKLSFSLLIMLAVSALVQVFKIHAQQCPDGFDIPALWYNAIDLQGGGVLGGLLGEVFHYAFDIVGSLIILIAGIGVLLMFLFGTTPRAIALRIRYHFKVASDRRHEARAQDEENDADEDQISMSRKQMRAEKRALRKKDLEDKDRQRRHEILNDNPEKPAEAVFTDNNQPVVVSDDETNESAQKVDMKPIMLSNGNDCNAECELKLSPSDEQKKKEEEEKARREEQKPQKAEKESKKVLEPVRRSADSKLVAGLEHDADFNDLNTLLSGDAKKVPEHKAQDKNGEKDPELGIITDVEDMSELMEAEEEPDIKTEQQAEYVFPPYDLLAKDQNENEDYEEELQENAKRLMDTLKSFNVRIKEINYSRGPTITRYELRPDNGVRIRTISNLVDDIALSLATAGVRIEAPIPGKSAVGVEVPNKHQATVYLRKLIESPTFTEAKGKLAVCLGEDVAGKPIYFNIDKMPHLLIAGATGMGKSVCINSIIVSILYKAKPSEVKLILVDPKKVEFNMYKDIPHLYVPVVSDPKKAAGVLATAVSEMERRFELIEEVNVRDINNYNKLAEEDPDIEPMPRIVIIIDELADLMMTASDNVETAICRLAQKARAAGIHLIIGTQRPSVDVITGLIKANIPSRIACKVSSQVDSRTIIDIAGAEKLIGRGDMLFAPVGAMKPVRVQGAFVGDTEVENIVEFIKEHNSVAHYDDQFIKQMEEEAEKCGNKKGAANIDSAAPEGGGDSKLRDAIELAIDSGKISTSLMQRRLEIGYGRAAKILDQMEELGYISPADGNKPRRVLITKEEYMEKVINDDV